MRSRRRPSSLHRATLRGAISQKPLCYQEYILGSIAQDGIDGAMPGVVKTEQGVIACLPGLKIISAHGGGYLPSYADRSDHACFVNPVGFPRRRHASHHLI
jgi:hypothetical protein